MTSSEGKRGCRKGHSAAACGRLAGLAFLAGLSACVDFEASSTDLTETENLILVCLLAGICDEGRPFSVTSNPSGMNDAALAFAMDAGHIYLAGYDNVPGEQQWRIEKRSKIDGSLDPLFGSGGVVQSNLSANNELIRGITILNGYIYIAGEDQSPGAGDRQWRIEKRSAVTGALDTAFDGDGRILTNLAVGNTDYVFDLTNDGTYLYVAGVQSIGFNQPRLERLDPASGSLVGGGGWGAGFLNDPNGSSSYRAITMNGSNLVLSRENGSGLDCSINQRDSGANNVAGFGTAGYVTIDPGGAGSEYCDEVTAGGGLIFQAINDLSLGGSNYTWRLDVVDSATGAYATGFLGSGILANNYSTGDDRIQAVATNGTDLYLGGRDETAGVGDAQLRLERRSATSGSLIYTYTENPSVNAETIQAILIDGTFIYLLIVDAGPGDQQWRLDKRYAATGSL